MANQDNKNQDNNNNNNNNFFNDNPLLAFAIFSIVIIMIFKSFVGEGESLGTDKSYLKPEKALLFLRDLLVKT